MPLPGPSGVIMRTVCCGQVWAEVWADGFCPGANWAVDGPASMASAKPEKTAQQTNREWRMRASPGPGDDSNGMSAVMVGVCRCCADGATRGMGKQAIKARNAALTIGESNSPMRRIKTD